jgi:asparagine synthase (glutamine-hydrolysing)
VCGLFGIFSAKKLSEADLLRANRARDRLIHRGPDNGGYWVSANLYVGHRRLSIIDISSSGNQPMVSDRAVIAVNGEIYNFQGLKFELEQAGFVFKSDSDSEVILHGYELWGLESLCEKLDGMYAAVIFDRQKNRLLFIRDRIGIKPLYYYIDNERLIWSSELKGVVNYIGSERLEIEPEAVIDFLTYRYIPAPKTVYKNVYKLCAAHTFEIDLASFTATTNQYWSLDTTERESGDDQNTTQLLALLRESVHQQLVSDVPLGLLLSGGVDSSAVAALATEKQKLNSFSIGFDDPKKDETRYAQIVAEHVESEHVVHYVKDAEVVALAEKLSDWFDEPFGDTSAIPTWLVSNLAKSRVKVALSGDGGDELFGGYEWYARYSRLRKLQKWFPLKSRQGFRFPKFIPKSKQLELLSISDPVVLYSRIRNGLPAYQLKHWMKRLGVSMHYDPYWAYRRHFDKSLGVRKAAQVIDFYTYLPDDILVKVDRVSMDVALECRPPFLSKKLVEFAFSLPESFHYRNGELKGGLKDALRGVLPSEILDRPKQGFSLPASGWKRTILGESKMMQEKLLEAFYKYIDRPL